MTPPTPPSELLTVATKSSAENAKSCNLQVRLIDGSRIQMKMTSESTLLDVWSKIESDHHLNRDGLCLVQPFPHVEYDASHDNDTLLSLNLFPNGNLVVKKVTVVEQERQSPEGQPAEIAPPLSEAPQISQPIVNQISNPMHNWGVGHILEDENSENDANARERGVGVDDDVGLDNENLIAGGGVEEEDDVDGDGEAFHGAGVGDDGADFWHQPFLPGQAVPPVDHHVWGQGQSLAEEVFGRPVIRHLDKDPKQLAAEAAKNRYKTVQPPSSSSSAPADQLTSSNSKKLTTIANANVQSLKQLTIRYITRALSRSIYALPTNLSGLPYDLAQNLLSDFIKQGLLTTKLLNLFVPCHLQKLNLDCYSFCTNELVISIRHHSYIKSISLQSCNLITDKGLHSLSGLKYLTYLNLNNCYQLSDSIVATLIALTSLEKLILENTSISDVGVVKYCQSNPPNLFLLVLSGSHVTDSCLPSLKLIPRLKKLSLERCQISTTDCISEIPNLQFLNLNGTKVTAESLAPLNNMGQLRVLSLSDTLEVSSNKALSLLSNLKLIEFHLPNRLTLSDRGIPFISRMPLEVLDLSNFIYITDESLPHIALITTLKKLLLRNTKVTDRGLLHLTSLIRLEELYLDRTELTDVGASIFQYYPNLKQLSLSITGITDVFITSGYLDACTQLTKLNLSKTSITSDGINRLRLPNLSLLNIDETFTKPELIDSLIVSQSLKIVYKNLLSHVDNEEAS